MIEVDGYKAFHGVLRITPVNGNEPFYITGDCLYKPETDCWYAKPERRFSQSFPADICETRDSAWPRFRIEVDGYKAFRGTLHVTPDVPGYAPYDLVGDCLYKPTTDCWYVRPDRGFSQSVPADICEVQEDA